MAKCAKIMPSENKIEQGIIFFDLLLQFSKGTGNRFLKTVQFSMVQPPGFFLIYETAIIFRSSVRMFRPSSEIPYAVQWPHVFGPLVIKRAIKCQSCNHSCQMCHLHNKLTANCPNHKALQFMFRRNCKDLCGFFWVGFFFDFFFFSPQGFLTRALMRVRIVCVYVELIFQIKDKRAAL